MRSFEEAIAAKREQWRPLWEHALEVAQRLTTIEINHPLVPLCPHCGSEAPRTWIPHMIEPITRCESHGDVQAIWVNREIASTIKQRVTEGRIQLRTEPVNQCGPPTTKIGWPGNVVQSHAEKTADEDDSFAGMVLVQLHEDDRWQRVRGDFDDVVATQIARTDTDLRQAAAVILVEVKRSAAIAANAYVDQHDSTDPQPKLERDGDEVFDVRLKRDDFNHLGLAPRLPNVNLRLDGNEHVVASVPPVVSTEAWRRNRGAVIDRINSERSRLQRKDEALKERLDAMYQAAEDRLTVARHFHEAQGGEHAGAYSVEYWCRWIESVIANGGTLEVTTNQGRTIRLDPDTAYQFDLTEYLTGDDADDDYTFGGPSAHQ